jgi:hypothetical protein
VFLNMDSLVAIQTFRRTFLTLLWRDALVGRKAQTWISESYVQSANTVLWTASLAQAFHSIVHMM